MTTQSPHCESRWMGEVPYSNALHLQKETLNKVSAQNQGVLIGLTHPNVITLGIRGTVEKDLLVDKDFLNSRNVEVVSTRRGGEATLHSPGQLVIYPILPLRAWKIGVKAYIHLLEKTSLEFLNSLGITAHVSPKEPGIYTEQGKIVFFGVQVSKGVSYHGIAINIFNELSLFQWIRSCGVDNESFDKVASHEVTNHEMANHEMTNHEMTNHEMTNHEMANHITTSQVTNYKANSHQAANQLATSQVVTNYEVNRHEIAYHEKARSDRTNHNPTPLPPLQKLFHNFSAIFYKNLLNF